MDSRIASKTYYRIWRITRRLWVRAALISTLAVPAALSASSLAWMVPRGLANVASVESLSSLLQVLASSMLAVTIFSLSVIISARQSASAQVTPRSHQILMEDRTTQNVLATFLGSFIYSLAGLIVLGTGLYEGPAITVMLGFTLLVIALVVIAILRWIDHLTELGSVSATTGKIERAAAAALDARQKLPCLGARPLTSGQLEVPVRAHHLQAWETGYVQHIDLKALSKLAQGSESNIYVVVQPGELVSLGETLVYYTADLDENALRGAFSLADKRVFEQDPRFGVIVLSEVAQRALSPGVNDPGTAIDVMTRLARVLGGYRDEADPSREVRLPRVWMSAVTADELVHDAFDPIARDGAGSVEIQIRLQKTLGLLAASGDTSMLKAAQAASERALELSMAALPLEEQRERVKALAAKV